MDPRVILYVMNRTGIEQITEMGSKQSVIRRALFFSLKNVEMSFYKTIAIPQYFHKLLMFEENEKKKNLKDKGKSPNLHSGRSRLVALNLFLKIQHF